MHKGFHPLSEVLKIMVKEMRIKGKLDEAAMRDYWVEIMGGFVAKKTKKVYFFKGTLFVILESDALKQELFMAREKIKTTLNEKLGENLIVEVVFR